jgi:D-alanyl-D-alanine-carboxypeptidase/D-alanyl-D-alanine-endopeptidase
MKIKLIHLLSSLTLLISTTNALADVAALDACLKQGYATLPDRRSIVAAAIDMNQAAVSTFGQAKRDQIFEIGSVTKTFTANLLAQSIIGGKINLDDPIPAHWQKPGATITYRHLTTHMSGIIKGAFPGQIITNELFPFEGLTIPVFKDLYFNTPLAATPGTKWQYSNMGETLLGLILAELSGQSYDQAVQEKILNTLGMTDSYFELPAVAVQRFPKGIMVDRRATGAGESQEMPHWDFYKTAADPTGGLRSTIDDMIRYTRANLDPDSTSLAPAIKLSQVPLLTFTPDHNVWMAMNWIVEPEKSLIWHNGETYGFNSIVAINTSTHEAVVAMTDTTVLTPSGFDTGLQDVAFSCLR